MDAELHLSAAIPGAFRIGELDPLPPQPGPGADRIGGPHGPHMESPRQQAGSDGCKCEWIDNIHGIVVIECLCLT